MNINKTMSSALLPLVVCLITACSGGDSPPATTTTSAASTPVPAADAGPDQSVFVGTIVKLNGSNSSSAPGHALTYSWSLRKPAGSTAEFKDQTVVNPMLIVDIGGTYEATLIVKDGNLTSAPDTILIVVGATNVAPAAAIAKPPQKVLYVLFKSAVTLDGSMSNDANRDLLIFKWKLIETPKGSALTDNPFSLGDTAAPLFTPDVIGDYRVQLIVNDGGLDSAPTEIKIIAENKPGPNANAGLPQTIPPIPNERTTVHLQGSGNAFVLNSDGTTTLTSTGLEYSWEIFPQAKASTPVATTDMKSATPTFTVEANFSGTYLAQLSVTEPDHPDPTRRTTTANVLILVQPKAIALPDAGRAQPGTSISFTGDTSIGPGGTGLSSGLTYSWTIVYTPASGGKQIDPKDLLGATATIPKVAAGTYTGRLTVTDSKENQDVDSATFVVTSGPMIDSVTLPAFSSPFITGQGATGLTLSVSNSWIFPDGQFIFPSPAPTTPTTVQAKLSGIIGTPSCQWASSTVTFTSRPPCTASSATATFSASQAGTYDITLSVTDPAFGPSPFSQTFYVRVATPPTITVTTSPTSPNVCTLTTVTAAVSGLDVGNALTNYSWTIKPPTPPVRNRSGYPVGGYSSMVNNSTIPVLTDNNTQAGLEKNLSNPARLNVLTDTTANFRPDVPGQFTVSLEVTDSLGVRTASARDLTVPSQYGPDPNKPPSATHTKLLDLRNSSCGSCHSIGMWSYIISPPSGYPEHSAKGLQLFHKFNANGTVSDHSGVALPVTPTETLEDFCALFQDLP